MNDPRIQQKQSHKSVSSNAVYSFHAILYSDDDDMKELWLPAIAEGFFRFSDEPEYRFLSISAKNGRWVASCTVPAFFHNVHSSITDEVPLQDGQLLCTEIDERSYTLYIQDVSNQQQVFHNYPFLANTEITIGSLTRCGIIYDNPHVSYASNLLVGSRDEARHTLVNLKIKIAKAVAFVF